VWEVHEVSGVDCLTDHIKTQKKLKDIPQVSIFEELLSASTLSDTDKEIIRLHYLKEKDFRYIGDLLGFSEATIKARHKKALKKLGSII
jgi:RNA polymerase sigma factor (sigma-70 family)